MPVREPTEVEREPAWSPPLPSHTLGVEHQLQRHFAWADLAVILVLVGILVGLAHLSLHAPPGVESDAGATATPGPSISLSLGMLPLYTLLSLRRLLLAYGLSLAFTVVFGYAAASSKRSERILLPTLDVLQSVPIFSFLPAVLLGLTAILPKHLAVEAASVVLIVTCQAWNIGFAWYQSLTTIPTELQEAATIFRFNGWMRFKTVQLPFASVSLIWNSMVSWANGWFFLMAAEMFKLGSRDFRLAGLGTWLKEAADRHNVPALLWGVATLLVVIVALDQLLWRPLLAWAERSTSAAGELGSRSWFYELLRGSRLAAAIAAAAERVSEAVDQRIVKTFPGRPTADAGRGVGSEKAGLAVAWLVMVLALYGVYRSVPLLAAVTGAEWREVLLGLLATLCRVFLSCLLALAVTLPIGVAIGTKPRLAAWLQPVVQLAASVPATALFPLLLWLIADKRGGTDIAAVILMIAGTQWYLLFNIIAGASSIPQEMQYTASLLGFSRWERWRTLFLPALWPYIITGAIVATGGAWNVCVVAEYTESQGRVLQTIGAGATITRAAGAGRYPLLLASTLSMVVLVILVNRFFWARLYERASERYKME